MELLREGEGGAGRLCGARVRDVAGGGPPFEIRARVVVNAGGPFTDAVRARDEDMQMPNGASRVRAQVRAMDAPPGGPPPEPICAPSSGTHLALPKYFTPDNMGLLDPATSDGRVIFFLPWEGATLVGTTDERRGAARASGVCVCECRVVRRRGRAQVRRVAAARARGGGGGVHSAGGGEVGAGRA